MGISAYVKYKGESVEESLKRESGEPDEWFGFSAATMAELEKLGSLAGIDTPLWGTVAEPWIPPEEAGAHATKLRRFLAKVEPGPSGSLTDEEMCGLMLQVISFLEVAERHDGYIVD